MMKNGLKSGSASRAHVMPDNKSPARDSALLSQAIAGVLRHAQGGDLPLFAWTLGLPRDAWLAMLSTYFPESKALEPMSPAAYAAIEKSTPELFRHLAVMLLEQRSPEVDSVHADWLARAFAAACLGSRHLWMDLGLRGRADVSALLSAWFPALHAKNAHNLKWKRFLFAELAARRGASEIEPPNCNRCDEFPICFPAASCVDGEKMESKEKAIELRGSVWMTVDGESFGGAGRVELLARIDECGSITQAAKGMKMSYKAAWDAIDSMNNLAGEPLVERLAGGKGGGGTRLTPRGKQLVENFKIIDQEHRKFVDQLSRQAEGIADDFILIRRMNMKTSARNQLLGKVSTVTRGAVNDEIELEIAGGQRIVASVTHESAASLGLQAGTEAFALIKASSVIVVTEGQGAQFSARNQLPGVISRVQAGAVNTEVVIDLHDGGAIAAIVTNESSDALALAAGKAATAIFKASSVILGVAT